MTQRNCLSNFSFHDIALYVLKYFLFYFSFPFGLVIFSSYPSYAQEYGRSPTFNIFDPSINNASYTISPNNGLTCPTPNLSIGAYGGYGNDWSNDYTTYNSTNNGINNYGVTIGVSIPIGGGVYSKYCKDYAKAVSEERGTQAEQVRRNNQMVLLKQCYFLIENKINLDQDAFKPGGVFSSLSACNNYDFQAIQGGENIQSGQNEEKKSIVEQELPLSDIKPDPPSNLILERQN